MEVNLEEAKRCLSSLTLCDHMGDVANVLPRLAKALGLPEPKWAYYGGSEGYVFPWDVDEINRDMLAEGEAPLEFEE